MKRVSLLFLVSIGVWGCGRQELIETVSDPESVYGKMRTLFNRRVDSIDELQCLGELHFTGGSRYYITLDYSSQGGVLEIFSPLRQRLGWVHFNPDTTTHSFEDTPGFPDLGGYGLLIGWSLVGCPPFPSDAQILKVGESSHSFYIGVRSKDLLYHFTVLKKPMVVQSMKIKRGESIIEVNFRHHREVGSHLFPYLLTGSTPEGDFELRYLEIR